MLRFAWLLLIAAAIYGGLSVFLPEKILRRRINRRQPLAFDEIYQKHFSSLGLQKTLVAEVWQEVAAALKLNAEKLRPDDRFGIELAVSVFPLVDLHEVLAARLHKFSQSEHHEFHSAKLDTLGGYIEFYARLKTAAMA